MHNGKTTVSVLHDAQQQMLGGVYTCIHRHVSSSTDMAVLPA